MVTWVLSILSVCHNVARDRADWPTREDPIDPRCVLGRPGVIVKRADLLAAFVGCAQVSVNRPLPTSVS